MKKNIAYLIVFVSAILLLVGWSQFGGAPETQEAKTVVSVSSPRLAVPDYPADGRVFLEKYSDTQSTDAFLEIPDQRANARYFNDWVEYISHIKINSSFQDNFADGKVFYDAFRQNSSSKSEQWVPDYPLDGKIFISHFSD